LAEINQTIYASKLQKEVIKKYRRIKGYYPKCHIVSSHMGRRTFATMFYGILPTSFLNANNWTLFRGYVAKIYWEKQIKSLL